jgi:hypothetical protein
VPTYKLPTLCVDMIVVFLYHISLAWLQYFFNYRHQTERERIFLHVVTSHSTNNLQGLIWYSDWQRARRPGFDSRQRQEIFLCSQRPYQLWVPNGPLYNRYRGALSLRVKWRGREADYSPPCSAEVKNGGAIPRLPHSSSWRGA